MRVKKFLQKVLGSGYSKSAKQVIFNAARSEEEADAVADLMDAFEEEEKVVRAVEAWKKGAR